MNLSHPVAGPSSVLPRSRSQAVQQLPSSFEVGERRLDRGAVGRNRTPAGEIEKDEVSTGEVVVNLGHLFSDGHTPGIAVVPAKVEVPVCFVDRMPLRGSWQVPTSGPPYEAVQLLFANCWITHGTWCPTAGGTGVWWGWCEIERKFTVLGPIGWRAMEPSHSG